MASKDAALFRIDGEGEYIQMIKQVDTNSIEYRDGQDPRNEWGSPRLSLWPHRRRPYAEHRGEQNRPFKCFSERRRCDV